MINNAASSSRSYNYQAPRNKVTYTGIFLDEPISNGGHLNPECEMIFTHITHIDVKQSADRSGFNEDTRTLYDCDVLSPFTADLDSNRSSERDFLLGPDHILDSLQSASPEEDSYENVLDSRLVNLSRLPQAKAQMSRYNSPQTQLKRIIHAVTKSSLLKTRDKFMDPDYGSNSFLDLSDPFVDRRNFRTHLEGVPATRTVGPTWYKMIRMSNLLSICPRLEDYTTVLQGMDNNHYDIIDEETPNLLSICSSIIKTSIPSIFADHAISDCTFRYATSDPTQRYIAVADRNPIWDVKHCMTYMPEPMEHVKSRLDLALSHLRDTVFKMVEEMAGDIDVLVEYSANEDTIVQLQLRDQTDVVNHDFVVHDGELGGLISPLIGSAADMESGEEAINGMLDVITNDDYNYHERYEKLGPMKTMSLRRDPDIPFDGDYGAWQSTAPTRPYGSGLNNLANAEDLI